MCLRCQVFITCIFLIITIYLFIFALLIQPHLSAFYLTGAVIEC